MDGPIAVSVLSVIVAFLIVAIFWLRTQNLALKDDLKAMSDGSEQKIMELVYDIRDTWDHLPRSLPICDQRRQLAQELAYSIASLYQDGKFRPFQWSEINKLVGEINDPVLCRLWENGERAAILSMFRTILFQPVTPEFDPDLVCIPDGPMQYGLVERKFENFLKRPYEYA